MSNTITYTHGDDKVYVGSIDTTYRGLSGNDTYYVDGLTSGILVISDDEGINTIRLANGLSIASSTIYHNAVQLTLSNGAQLQVLNCDLETTQFDLGGTISSAGKVVDFHTFVTKTLGTEVPSPDRGCNIGGSVIIGQETGQQYVLTTDQDFITGTSGNDTIYGFISDNIKATTFQAYDHIDAGEGTDTFRLTLSNSSYFGDGQISDIEILSIRATGAAPNYYGGGFKGLTHIYSDMSDQDLVISDLTDPSITLGLRGQSVHDLTAIYTSSTLTGSETVHIELDDAGATTAPSVKVVAASGTEGVETITIDVIGSDTSKLTTLEAQDSLNNSTLTTVTISGDQQLTVTNDIDFAGAAGTGIVDASATTGGIDVCFTAGDKVDVTGGVGNDIFSFATGLDKTDRVDGGGGNDTLAFFMGTGTTKLADLDFKAIEIIRVTAIADNAVLDADGFSGLSSFDALGANGAKSFTAMNLASDSTVGLLSSAGASNFANLAYSLKDDTGTRDVLNVTLDSLDHITGVDLTATDSVTVNGVETINLTSTGFLPSTEAHSLFDANTADTKDGLVANRLSTINITGESSLDLEISSDDTMLTTFNASALTGKLDLLFHAATDLNLHGGSGDDNFDLSTPGIDYKDTIDGGAGSKDVLTAKAASLNAMTGALNISNIETVNLTVENNATTLNLANVTGAAAVNVMGGGAAGAVSIGNLGAGTVLGLGSAGAAVASALTGTVTVAQEATTVDVNQTFTIESTAADNNVDVAVRMENVDTATFALAEGVNATQIDASGLRAESIVVTGGQNGKTIDFTDGPNQVKFYKETTTLDSTAATCAVKANFANAESAVTVNAELAGGDNSLTGSARDDIFTVTHLANADTIDGGTGNDSLVASIAEGATDLTRTQNFESYTLSTDPGVSVDIGNLGGVDSATTTSIAITGGSSSTIFDTLGAAITNTAALTKVDASGCLGGIRMAFADNTLTNKIAVTGGAGQDLVKATYGNAAPFTTNNTLNVSEVENLALDIGGNNNATIDFTNISGVENLILRSANGSTGDFILNNFNSDSTTVQIGGTIDGTQVELANSDVTINLASATGTSDSLALQINDTNGDTNAPAITAAGIETLTVEVSETVNERQGINLANVSATDTETIAATFTGGFVGRAINLNGINSDFASIDASTYQGDFVMLGRVGTSAMTINTGSGEDYIAMQNSADVLNAGAGADTLDINCNAVVGSMQIDLSATGDQILVFNGLTNTAVQTGFTNADLSGYTGGNGAEITANAAGGTIRGTNAADQINGSESFDRIYGNDGNDLINGFGGDDQVNGDAGNDTLYGGAGNDVLKGGDGNDFIIGGEGSNNLFGEAGDDTYLFSTSKASAQANMDRIYAWTVGTNVIDFTDLVNADLRGNGTGFQARAGGENVDANAGLVNFTPAIAGGMNSAAVLNAANLLNGWNANDAVYFLVNDNTDSCLCYVADTTGDAAIDTCMYVAKMSFSTDVNYSAANFADFV